MRAARPAGAAARKSARGWGAFRRREKAGGSPRVPATARRLRDLSLNATLHAYACIPSPSNLHAQLRLLLSARGTFTPAAPLLARLVATAAAAAAASPPTPLAPPGALAADAAAEAFARLVDGGLCRPSPPLLAAVARAAALDPVADRRGARVLSVISHLRTLKTAPTPELVGACFDTAVSAVDVQMVAAIHNFALANGLCVMQTPVCDRLVGILRRSAFAGDDAPFFVKEGSADDGGGGEGGHGLPAALKFYNGVLRTALFAADYRVAAAAFREVYARGVGVNVETLALLAALHAKLDDAAGAGEIVVGLQEEGFHVPSVAYSSLIRCYGKKGQFLRARQLFDEWERTEREEFWQLLSSPCKMGLADGERVSAKTLASAGDCVVLSMFLAGRAAADAKGAVEFLEHLEEKYGYQCSPFVTSIVMETCCRSGHKPLVDRMRAKMEEQTSRLQTPCS